MNALNILKIRRQAGQISAEELHLRLKVLKKAFLKFNL